MESPDTARSSGSRASPEHRAPIRASRSGARPWRAAFLLLSALGCSSRADMAANAASNGIPSPPSRSGRHLLLVLEPGVCFGCMQVPQSVDVLRTLDAARVTYVWRRSPNEREQRAAVPLRLPISGTLATPWPTRAPVGLVAVLYADGRPILIDSVGMPQALDSMARLIMRGATARQ